jgi:hypothetical protein
MPVQPPRVFAWPLGYCSPTKRQGKKRRLRSHGVLAHHVPTPIGLKGFERSGATCPKPPGSPPCSSDLACRPCVPRAGGMNRPRREPRACIRRVPRAEVRQLKPGTASIHRLTQFGEKRLRLQQILGVEAFGEPAVNRSEQLIRFPAFALAVPQPSEAG